MLNYKCVANYFGTEKCSYFSSLKTITDVSASRWRGASTFREIAPPKSWIYSADKSLWWIRSSNEQVELLKHRKNGTIMDNTLYFTWNPLRKSS